MKIENEETLSLFRTLGDCELCGKACRVREPHHIWARGQSSSKRLDVRINLIALGSTPQFQCECHTRIGMGQIEHKRVLGVVAAREKTTPEIITDTIWLLQRLPKSPAPGDDRIQFWLACEREMRGMTAAAKELAVAIIKEAVGTV